MHDNELYFNSKYSQSVIDINIRNRRAIELKLCKIIQPEIPK